MKLKISLYTGRRGVGRGDIGTAPVHAMAPAELACTSGKVSSGVLSAWPRSPVQVAVWGLSPVHQAPGLGTAYYSSCTDVPRPTSYVH